jgi:signal transduction histidine kinase
MRSMSEIPVDPRWPKLLSLSVHEFRTPLTVVAGYVRMLLKERAGPLNDQQRKLLEETEKSCARLSVLLSEMSELANLEGGTAPISRESADLRGILRTVVEHLPPLPDRDIAVTLQTGLGPATIQADAQRLANAVTSVVSALRRELVTSDQLFVREERVNHGSPAHRILIGDQETLDAIESRASELPVFDEWRGGCGMALAVARRVLNAHGARIWSAPDGRKAGAVIEIPVPA